MTTAKNFGEYLRNKRLNDNLTQRDVARLLGVDRSFVSKLERNIRKPNYQDLSEIVFGWLQLSPNYARRLIRQWDLV